MERSMSEESRNTNAWNYWLSLQLKDHIYALKPEDSLFIGKRIQGNISNYYLGQPITDEEVAAVQTAAESLNVDVLNTRSVFRVISEMNLPSFIHISNSVRKNGPNDFTLLVASADPKPQVQHEIKNQEAAAKLTVEYGDFAEPLQKAVAALQEVVYCADLIFSGCLTSDIFSG